ncbi:MAG: sigma-70 family RNA polymerase sigma factor [Bacteroidota bacterium]
MTLIEYHFIEGCKQGDASAQQQLYETYLPYLLTIVRRFGIQEQNIADLMQEIFVEIFLNIEKYDPSKGEFKYWVKVIAIRKTLKYLHKIRPTPLLNLSQIKQEEISIDQDFEELETAYIIKMISELPEQYRTVFNLHTIDGYSHKEISQQLGIQVVSSRSRLSRAKKMLRQKLLQYWKNNKLHGVF